MITIIVAVSQNGIIGDKNSLLWHITEDLQRFRRLTSGHPVIMGRKTFESIGRPLPNRTNVVVTRGNSEFEGCRRAGSLEEAVAMFNDEDEVFVIGGAQIYAEALKIADRMQLTVVEHDYEGDTAFPSWSAEDWRLVSSERYECGEKFAYPFRFELYEKK